MTISQAFKFHSTAAAQGVNTLQPGKAVSLAPRAAMVLRVAEGQAWVTLDAGPYGTGAEAGDVFLNPGQTLWVGAGQHAVVEPLGSQRLQYRWARTAVEAAAASPAPWWRRAAFGNAAAVDQRVSGDACCA